MRSEDVAIFWDYENCHASSHITGYEIVKRIRTAAHDFGVIKLFKAYLELSDPGTFSKSLGLRSELQASGVSLTDCPHNGRKDVADKMILVDMLAYAIDNPAPSTIILISGDRDFAYAVSILRLRRYRVVIVSLAGVHASLKAQASIFLDWTTDVIDEGGSRQSKVPRSYSGKTKLSPQPPVNRLDSEDGEVDIMDHFPVNDANRSRRRYGLGRDIPVEEANSYRDVLGTHDSCGSNDDNSFGIIRSPSRTESAPAALYTDELEPASEDVNQSKTTPGFAPVIPRGNVQIPKAATFVIPLTEPQQHKQAPPARFSPPAAPASGSIPVRPRVNEVADFREGQARKLDTVMLKAPIPKQAVSLPSERDPSVLSPVSLSMPVGSQEAVSLILVVAPIFRPLVERLEDHRSKGFYRPFRSVIAVELASKDHSVYRRAGVERFGPYATLAEKEGIIELGGKEGGAWIALRPQWYGARLI